MECPQYPSIHTSSSDISNEENLTKQSDMQTMFKRLNDLNGFLKMTDIGREIASLVAAINNTVSKSSLSAIRSTQQDLKKNQG